MINKSKLEEFCKSLSLNTEYKFLEEGKDADELKKVAEKRGIVLPAMDLAIFKGKFAFTDRKNLNGCSLPKTEVEKSLQTLVGKAIDFDHIRDRIVGFWLDAILEGDTIYAYGAFYKGNLGNDYEIVKELMSRNALGISFEAYGKREFKDDGSYDLKDIEWSGGGLLINTKPAFPGAGVIEMASNQKRILELASLMTEPKEYIKSIEEKKLEFSRLWTWDMETIMRMSSQVICPMCKAEGTIDVNEIDFKENSIEATCWMCGADMEIELTPKSTMMLKDSASRQIKEVKKVEKTEDTNMSKVDKASVQEADALIKTEGEAPSENADEVVAEVAKNDATDSDGKTVEQIIAETKGEVKAEVVTATPEVKDEVIPAQTEALEMLKAEILALKEEISKSKARARDEGKVIGERRSALGEFAKDMTDDDVLDNVKYENATLRKKLAEVEASKSVVVSETATTKTETKALEVGTKDEAKETPTDKLAKSVRKLAWNV